MPKTIDTLVLATSWLRQPALGRHPARTLLVVAATLTASYRFGALAFDLQADSSTVTDDPAGTMTWLAERLPANPARLLLWRAEDIVVPSLIASAETASVAITGARLMRAVERAFTGEVIDVANAHGGACARSFDAIAHRHGLPFVEMSRPQLEVAHHTGCHGDIQTHLAARAKAMWQLWLLTREDGETLRAMTDRWLADPEAELRL